MNLPDFLKSDEAGDIRLVGHRIGLYHVVHYYNEGYSAEMLACQYPSLPLALIHKVIAFYLENRIEVEAYVEAYLDELQQQRAANPNRVNVAALEERFARRVLR